MAKVEEIYNQIKDKLETEERSVLSYIFELLKDRPKTDEDFRRLYLNSDNEGMREYIRSALKKCPNEIKEMERASNIYISSNIWIKMGDVVEVDMQMDEPQLDKETDEMQREYFIRYSLDDEEVTSFSFEAEDGIYENDICYYLKHCIKNDIGISEYEIFNYDSCGDNQFAQVRVKAISDSWKRYGN